MTQSESRVLKLTRALYARAQQACPPYASKFSKRTFTQHQHLALCGLKKRLKEDYRDLTDLLSEMPRIQRELGLEKLPDYTTLCKAFGRLSSLVFQLLLELTIPSELSGIYGIDATGFTRSQISKHYIKRCKVRIRSMKCTFLVHSGSQLIVGIMRPRRGSTTPRSLALLSLDAGNG